MRHTRDNTKTTLAISCASAAENLTTLWGNALHPSTEPPHLSLWTSTPVTRALPPSVQTRKKVLSWQWGGHSTYEIYVESWGGTNDGDPISEVMRRLCSKPPEKNFQSLHTDRKAAATIVLSGLVPSARLTLCLGLTFTYSVENAPSGQRVSALEPVEAETSFQTTLVGNERN